MSVLKLGQYSIPYTLIFSSKRKKSLSLQIKTDGIIVRAPKRMSQSFIDKFIENKEQRIIKKREQQLILNEKKKYYTKGSTVSYFGEEYPLMVIKTDKKRSSLLFDGTIFTVALPEEIKSKDYEEMVQKQIAKWHKIEAKKLLPLRTFEFAVEHSLKVKNVFIKTYRRKYGQCKGHDISYDWRIVQFPQNVIDHIILHELAHIRHKHHRRSFRDTLRSYDKNFDESLKRLKDNGKIIHC